MLKKILTLFLISSQAFAGLPPTMAKGQSDASNKVTFNLQAPKSQMTRVGATTALIETGNLNVIGDPGIENPSAISWNTYADAGQATPENGTGGSANITFDRSTSSPLRGTGSGLFTKGGSANRQGEGVSYDFTIDTADQAKVLQITFDYTLVSGTYATGDLTLYVYDVTNATVIQPAGYQILGVTAGTQMKHSATFQTASNSTSYRLILHVASTSASDYSLKFDNFYVGPQPFSMGPAMSDEVAYIPTVTSLGTVTGMVAYTSRRGDKLYGRFYFAGGTAGAGAVKISLPAGVTIDTTKANVNMVVGKLVATSSPHSGALVLNNADRTQIYFATNAANYQTGVAGTTWTNGTGFSGTFEVPISGWSSNVVQSADTDTRVVAGTAWRSTDQTGVNPNNSSIKVAFNSTAASSGVGGDSTGAFDTSNNRYVVRVPGWYIFTSRVSVSPTNVLNNFYRTDLYKNGSLLQYGVRQTQATGVAFGMSFASTPVYASAGDYFEMYLNGTGNNSASTLTIVGASNETFFGVHRLSGPAQIQATETVAAEYKTTSFTSLANANHNFIDFNSKDSDTHGAVLGAGSGNSTTATNTWRYVCMVSGRYDIDAVVTLTGGSPSVAIDTFASIWVNGTIVQKGQRLVVTAAALPDSALLSMPVSGKVRCKAGDYISIALYQSSGDVRTMGAGASDHRVSIVRVGNY